MGYVRSRKFCCCLPVRLGVFVLSTLITLLGGLVAVVSWLEVKKLQDDPVSDKAPTYIQAAIFTLLTLVGGFGLIGCIAKQRALVAMFGTALAIHLGFSVASGIYTIYTLYKRDETALMSNCIINSDEVDAAARCRNGLRLLKIIVVVAYSLSWLVELWACLVINSYVKQLKDEEEANIVQPTAAIPSFYAPPAPHEPNAYPFTQANQSHGYQA
ncbi:hypothetical protein MKEN_00518900 [Mycena kentingensis (nom. inval.)]|nr:hypothetical protein MKEN_00518900 [Mycena kentingensis (nom. inval.)]